MDSKTPQHPCRGCACSERVVVRLNGINRFGDLCNHPAGAKAFEPACAWHGKGAEVRALESGVRMSGGHYNYAYSTMRNCADAIADDARNHSEPHVDRWGFAHAPLPPDIIDLISHAAVTLLRDAQMARDIEWYMSGDYGDDTLRECAKSWALRTVPPDEKSSADEGQT